MAIEITVRELFDLFRSGSDMEKDQIDTVFLQGWIRTCRQEDDFVIAEISDGTCLGTACVRLPKGSICPKTGAAVSVVGQYCETGKDSGFFVDASEVTCEAQGRPELFAGEREVSRRRIRSSIFMAVHEFFQSQGFMLYLIDITFGHIIWQTDTVNFQHLIQLFYTIHIVIEIFYKFIYVVSGKYTFFATLDKIINIIFLFNKLY